MTEQTAFVDSFSARSSPAHFPSPPPHIFLLPANADLALPNRSASSPAHGRLSLARKIRTRRLRSTGNSGENGDGEQSRDIRHVHELLHRPNASTNRVAFAPEARRQNIFFLPTHPSACTHTATSDPSPPSRIRAKRRRATVQAAATRRRATRGRHTHTAICPPPPQTHTPSSTRTMAFACLIHRSFLRPLTRRATLHATCSTRAAASALSAADPEQARLMSERVILVNRHDTPIGSSSKADAHLVSNNLPLHRAFSLFLFDASGRMLLQKRAGTKVTFARHWTNAVCSHPLDVPSETGADDGGDAVKGAARAAVRKLSHELGVPAGAVKADELKFLTRLHYRAESGCGVWGEHEMDYVFFAQKEVETAIVPNEVEEIRYVDRGELRELYEKAADGEVEITPWFRYIVDGFGWRWWDVLMEEGVAGLEGCVERERIHRVGGV